MHWSLYSGMVNREQDLLLIVHFLYQCPFRRLEAVFCPFICTGEMNVTTDYEQFFIPIITKIHIGHIVHKTYLLNILTQKWHFSNTQIRRKLTLLQTCLT